MRNINTPLRAVVLSLAGLMATTTSFAQTAAQQDAESAKKWSVYWGWNRSNYSNSDIHFSGANHDFTLKNVAAADIQTDATWANVFGIYLRPSEITIPQTNMRVAYQWSEDTAIALNLDHMKYVMTPDQVVSASGQINGGPIPGLSADGKRVLDVNFLNFEHTDGLNIISLEWEKQRPVDLFGSRFPARVFGLVGAGVVLPKSNVTLNMLGRARNDEFHLAGYSAGVGAGVEVDFHKDFFFRTAYKLGYVNLPDVVTSAQGDKAAHSFTYNELLIAFGMRF